MEATDVIDIIAAVLADKPVIRALFLGGSHGNGRADAYSDIDFVLVSANGATDEIASLWRDAVGRTGEIVLWRDRTVRPVLINAITEDWTRIDLIVQEPGRMGAHVRSDLAPVFDHDGIHADLPESALPQRTPPARLRYQFEEFIRILGLLHLVMGREEYINGVTGLFHLRALLVDLLIEETAAPDRGGALHLNRLLSAEQKSLVTGLPPLRPEREAIVAAHLAYARAYLPRARRLAAERGIDWPERFEVATWAMLGEAIGIERPYA
ncbi:nucleotidyltransferase domain-containing protein [Jannaschia sp. S6380]|uniref:nucleotidyltransferase domain-containing protein n=1 Tax=Jannaschia sp. S6380 TaxID=2926408 RepID=UPI001FF0E725|nr:nucleotidyltransferase domain-containing protein [Jannaschia sp. S6380]MCK0168933.1 nucleotidyltransferase domain-containing protein [Jannaschia sp. S6380]